MRRSSKQQTVQQVSLQLSGGVNWAQSPANIADNELTRAQNFIYDPETDYLVSRPGTTCQTAAVCDGANAILRGYYYEKSSSVAYHVAACNGNLYYLSGAGLDAWTAIGALTDATTTPAFLTFNNKLLIADGGTAIRTWDGSTYATLAGSPAASVLSMIRNRVVCNAVDEPDSVYLSGPNDETDWTTTAPGAAIGLKAGFGDMLQVNAFSVFGDDLIVSKKGDREKRLYRVNVADATPTNWYVSDLSQNNAAVNAHVMLGAWNNVYFLDSNGFKSIRGTADYGDLQADAIGRKINTLFTPTTVFGFLTYVPSLNVIWFGISDRVICYTERNDPTTGSRVPAFTNLTFGWGRCTSVYEAGDDVYMTGVDGYLHKLDDSVSTDETAPGVTVAIPFAVRTKTNAFFVDGVVRKMQWYLKPKNAGTAVIYVVDADGDKHTLTSFDLPAEGEYLYDATGYLDDATGYLYDTGTLAWVETTRNRFRADSMAFELELTSGRCGVEWVKAEIALLEGGE